jgi:hypothetical protein
MWWHMVMHGRESEGETGEWSGWPVLFTLPRNMVYPALLPLMRTPRLSVVDWTDAPADFGTGVLHLNFSTPVCKMWLIREPKKVALWNKRHFEAKNEECAACLKYSVLIFVEKIYTKCDIWRVAVRPSYIWDARLLKVKWTRPFRRKMKSGFCACANTFQTQSTISTKRLETTYR